MFSSSSPACCLLPRMSFQSSFHTLEILHCRKLKFTSAIKNFCFLKLNLKRYILKSKGGMGGQTSAGFVALWTLQACCICALSLFFWATKHQAHESVLCQREQVHRSKSYSKVKCVEHCDEGDEALNHRLLRERLKYPEWFSPFVSNWGL